MHLIRSGICYNYSPGTMPFSLCQTKCYVATCWSKFDQTSAQPLERYRPYHWRNWVGHARLENVRQIVGGSLIWQSYRTHWVTSYPASLWTILSPDMRVPCPIWDYLWNIQPFHHYIRRIYLYWNLMCLHFAVTWSQGGMASYLTWPGMSRETCWSCGIAGPVMNESWVHKHTFLDFASLFWQNMLLHTFAAHFHHLSGYCADHTNRLLQHNAYWCNQEISTKTKIA